MLVVVGGGKSQSQEESEKKRYQLFIFGIKSSKLFEVQDKKMSERPYLEKFIYKYI